MIINCVNDFLSVITLSFQGFFFYCYFSSYFPNLKILKDEI